MGARRILKLTNQGELRLYEDLASGSNKITLKAPATLAADLSFILPSSAGSAGQVLQTDGAGQISYQTSSWAMSSFRQVGTSPMECWYAAGGDGPHVTAGAGLGVGEDILMAVPFAAQPGGTIDRIRYDMQTAGSAGSLFRHGIYEATSSTNLYPSARLLNVGPVAGDVTSAIHSTSTAITAGKIYWFAFVSTDSGGLLAPDFLALQGGATPILGFGNVAPVVMRNWIQVAFPFASLPDPFPAGATLNAATTYPSVLFRLSA